MNQLQSQQPSQSQNQPGNPSQAFSASDPEGHTIQFDNTARIIELAQPEASPTPGPGKPQRELTPLNEEFAEEFARWNQDIMGFADEHYFKGEPPATFEKGMIVSGAKALARRMTAPVQERFAIGAFFTGWLMYLTPRIVNMVARQKQEKELREKASSEEEYRALIAKIEREKEEKEARRIAERAEQARQIKKAAAARRKSAKVKPL